jgi:hypothetical protein
MVRTVRLTEQTTTRSTQLLVGLRQRTHATDRGGGHEGRGSHGLDDVKSLRDCQATDRMGIATATFVPPWVAPSGLDRPVRFARCAVDLPGAEP